MNDAGQFIQSNAYFAELKEQLELINKKVESGETVQLYLTENNHSISLKIKRHRVVKSNLSVGKSRKTHPPSDNKSLVALVTNNFSFDIGDINRQIHSNDVAAQIKHASDKKAVDKTVDEIASGVLKTSAALPGLPDPAVRYKDNLWILAEDCLYTTNDGFAITVKSGYKTDLASIPRIFWALISSFELSLAAPIFHDLIYRSAGEVALPDGEVAPVGKIFTRAEADNIFLELMTRAKISYWKRNVAYLAVHYFAEFAWRKLHLD